MQRFSPIEDKLANEAQAREIARVLLELRGHVLRLAVELAEGGEPSAGLLRLAASELGAENGPPVLPRNGDDRIQTPDALAPRGSSGPATRTCGKRGSPWWSYAPCPSRRTGPSSASS
jgi:hypothetical protein